jgi:glycosyltransferase involved in cell wall biosynthesis
MALLVFSDDWGRHPTSCQHLVRHLLDKTSVIWVNTIGMRRPRFEWYTIRRGLEKVGQWIGSSGLSRPAAPELDNLRVVSPVLWPGSGADWERRLNVRLARRKLLPILRDLPDPPIGVTTMPTAADILFDLPLRKVIYYCVDDFSTWPGLDHRAVRTLEDQLIDRADRVIAVSETLVRRVAMRNKTATLLTHGVDVDAWRPPDPARPRANAGVPTMLFWGLIDRRMDIDILRALSDCGKVLLVGPQDNPDPAIARLAHVEIRPAVPPRELPSLAGEADVLIVPYADLDVTRAIQPLKLKEYLATGKPVVARSLPAVMEWADCLDLASEPAAFAAAVRRRTTEGLTEEQRIGRQRLAGESWAAKAESFYQLIVDGCESRVARAPLSVPDR